MLEKNAGLRGNAGSPLADLFLRILQAFGQAGAYFPAFQGFDAQPALRIQVRLVCPGRGGLLGQDGITGGECGYGAGTQGGEYHMFHMTVRQGRRRNCHNTDGMLTRIIVFSCLSGKRKNKADAPFSINAVARALREPACGRGRAGDGWRPSQKIKKQKKISCLESLSRENRRMVNLAMLCQEKA